MSDDQVPDIEAIVRNNVTPEDIAALYEIDKHLLSSDWITASLARLAPELQTNHPPFSPFERLSLEMFRGAFELIALIADGSAARGGNQARVEELCAQFGIELPVDSATSTATGSPQRPEPSAAEET